MFEELPIEQFEGNPTEMFRKNWALLVAGDKDGYNTMTIGWGMLGAVWNRGEISGRPVCPTIEVFVRPSRYTKQFVDEHDTFTVCFFPESERRALAYLGSHSGRDEDKVAHVGLTPHFIDNTVAFEQACMVFVCKKIYQHTITSDNFIDKTLISSNYADGDFHDAYIGEIKHVLVKASIS